MQVETEHLPKGSDLDIQYQDLIPGRALHVRVNSEPPVDVFHVYQHAWNPTKGCYVGRDQDPVTLLMQDRAAVLQKGSSWVAAVPQRSQLILAGDFNSYLTACHAHVGYGLAPHSSSAQRDQKSVQAMVQRLGLVAANTWHRAGPQSATFRNHVDQAVQIDFVFVRIPCNVPQLKTRVLHHAPTVPETGFRHFPIELEVPCPVLPHTAKTSIITAKVACQRLYHAETAVLFSNQVQQLISASTPATDLNRSLLLIGQQTFNQAQHARRDSPTPQRPNLQLYWQCKHELKLKRSSQALSQRLQVSCWTRHLVTGAAMQATCSNVHAMLGAWKAAAQLQQLVTLTSRYETKRGSRQKTLLPKRSQQTPKVSHTSIRLCIVYSPSSPEETFISRAPHTVSLRPNNLS